MPSPAASSAARVRARKPFMNDLTESGFNPGRSGARPGGGFQKYALIGPGRLGPFFPSRREEEGGHGLGVLDLPALDPAERLVEVQRDDGQVLVGLGRRAGRDEVVAGEE